LLDELYHNFLREGLAFPFFIWQAFFTITVSSYIDELETTDSISIISRYHWHRQEVHSDDKDDQSAHKGRVPQNWLLEFLLVPALTKFKCET